MYFKLVLSFALLVFSSNVFGQISYGVKAGVNFPKFTLLEPVFIMDGDEFVGFDGDKQESVETKAVTNFYITGFTSIMLSNRIALEPGITLEGRGGKIPGNDYEANYMFVGVPLAVSYYLPMNFGGDVVISAGGHYGLNFGGTYKGVVDITDPENPIIDETDISYGRYEDFRKDDYGLNFGLGYKFNNGILINTSYTLGLRNLGTVRNEELKSRGFSFGIGYQF
ncbi:outer membrane beta-barrel protein [Sphingobacterium bovistauri]|uniref:PorT family protein n=1 Tax=Sphingobacterium bovistauri TaxID=2781959 RepID=A0ABS7Z6X2_9SPHI|nr:outer membrane beta-barrel protein [Sphingobacterium bovistauri]MCA5004469.1 PorT family protein [Sphingobacterium bovistauri]